MIGITNSNVSDGIAIIDEFFVKVIDYDGSIIDEKYMHNGEIYILPSAPSHNGLIFQEWSCSQNISNNRIEIKNNNVIIGAIYTTTSGQNEFDIELNNITGLSVQLKLDGTKDWGDGTSDTTTTHTYSQIGKYTIKCDGTTITATSSSGIFGQNSNTTGVNYYVKDIRLATITNIKNYTFQHCRSLQTITLSNKIETLGQSGNSYAFQYCYALRALVVPNGVEDTFGNNICYYCYSLTRVVIPKNISSIGSQAFRICYSLVDVVIPNNTEYITAQTFAYCYSISSIIIPDNVISFNGDYIFQDCHSLKNIRMSKNASGGIGNTAFRETSLSSIFIPQGITNIANYAFRDSFAIKEYDFSQHTSVPTLSNTNAFTGINPACKIKVPNSLLSQWKAATNWSTYADYIIGV